MPTACSRPAPGPSSLRKREGGSSPRRPHEQAPPTKPARPRWHANVALALNTTPKLASPTVRGEAAATAVSGTPQSLEPSRNRPAAPGSSCPPGGTALAPAGPVWASPPCSHLASGLAADTTCQSTVSLLMTGEGLQPGREETSPHRPPWKPAWEQGRPGEPAVQDAGAPRGQWHQSLRPGSGTAGSPRDELAQCCFGHHPRSFPGHREPAGTSGQGLGGACSLSPLGRTSDSHRVQPGLPRGACGLGPPTAAPPSTGSKAQGPRRGCLPGRGRCWELRSSGGVGSGVQEGGASGAAGGTAASEPSRPGRPSPGAGSSDSLWTRMALARAWLALKCPELRRTPRPAQAGSGGGPWGAPDRPRKARVLPRREQHRWGRQGRWGWAPTTGAGGAGWPPASPGLHPVARGGARTKGSVRGTSPD